MHVNRRKNTISEKVVVFFYWGTPQPKTKEKKNTSQTFLRRFCFQNEDRKTEIEQNDWNLWTGS